MEVRPLKPPVHQAEAQPGQHSHVCTGGGFRAECSGYILRAARRAGDEKCVRGSGHTKT